MRNLIALGLSCFYLIYAFLKGGVNLFLSTIIFLIIPLGCIFFSEGVGGYTGFLTKVPVTKESPGCFIALMGWIMLIILPLVAWFTMFKQ